MNIHTYLTGKIQPLSYLIIIKIASRFGDFGYRSVWLIPYKWNYNGRSIKIIWQNIRTSVWLSLRGVQKWRRFEFRPELIYDPLSSYFHDDIIKNNKILVDWLGFQQKFQFHTPSPMGIKYSFFLVTSTT